MSKVIYFTDKNIHSFIFKVSSNISWDMQYIHLHKHCLFMDDILLWTWKAFNYIHFKISMPGRRHFFHLVQFLLSSRKQRQIYKKPFNNQIIMVMSERILQWKSDHSWANGWYLMQNMVSKSIWNVTSPWFTLPKISIFILRILSFLTCTYIKVPEAFSNFIPFRSMGL